MFTVLLNSNIFVCVCVIVFGYYDSVIPLKIQLWKPQLFNNACHFLLNLFEILYVGVLQNC